MISKSASQLELYKECFSHLAEENSIFAKVLQVLELIANSKTGLGEVMQDYARQAYSQLKAIIMAGQHIVNAQESQEDAEILHNADTVIRTVTKFLELTPAAMKRNNAQTIGRKEKISSKNIEQITYIFANCPETKLLLTYEHPPENPPVHANSQ